jgi:hypothetical protein
MKALLDEAKAHGLGSVAHLGQMGVAQMNAQDAARLGPTTMVCSKPCTKTMTCSRGQAI